MGEYVNGSEFSDQVDYTLGHTGAADPAGVAHLPAVGFCQRCTGTLHETDRLTEDGRKVCVCDGCAHEYAKLEKGQRPTSGTFYVADQIDWEWVRKNTVREK